jgi:hypothetical protein
MDYSTDKVDEAVLALLHLTSFKSETGVRAWKGLDWASLERLHGKGYIGNPKSKSKSVVMTDEGTKQSEEFFKKHFC